MPETQVFFSPPKPGGDRKAWAAFRAADDMQKHNGPSVWFSKRFLEQYFGGIKPEDAIVTVRVDPHPRP